MPLFYVRDFQANVLTSGTCCLGLDKEGHREEHGAHVPRLIHYTGGRKKSDV